MSTFLQIHNYNVGANLLDIFVADVAVIVATKAGEPFAAVGDDDLLYATSTMVEFEVDHIADAVAGFQADNFFFL